MKVALNFPEISDIKLKNYFSFYMSVLICISSRGLRKPNSARPCYFISTYNCKLLSKYYSLLYSHSTNRMYS